MKLRIFILLLIFCKSIAFSQSQQKLTLRYCVEVALTNNITMKQALASVEGSKINVKQSKMNRYPSVNGAASQSINFGRSVNPYDNTVVENQRVNSNNVSLSANVNVFSGFQNRFTIQQRELDLLATQNDIGTTKNNIVLGVVESFANVLSSKAVLLSNKAQFESTNAQIDRTDKLVSGGRLPITSLYDLKAQLATEETNIVIAENNLELAKLNLAQWMQVDPSEVQDVLEPEMTIGELSEKSAKEIYNIALQTQPQIKAANTRFLSAEKGIGIAKSGLYPSLSFQAGLFTNYSSLAQRFVPGNPYASPVIAPVPNLIVTGPDGEILPVAINQVTVLSPGTFQDLGFNNQFQNNLRKGFSFNLNIPIFNGMQSRFAVESAKINRLNAKLQLDQEKNQLRQTIETAVTNEKAARNRLQAVEKQIVALKEAFRFAEQRFNLGVINSVDYLVAKNNLTRAENDKARFRYDYFIRKALVDFYQGNELNFN